MKCLADMGISPRSVAFLRNSGVDAVHVHELGLDRLPDARIVEKARSGGYVLLTHDLDFGELLALSGADLPRVVIFQLQSMRPSNVNRYLQILMAEHEAALNEGAILSVSDSHIRVRRLPIER